MGRGGGGGLNENRPPAPSHLTKTNVFIMSGNTERQARVGSRL